MSLLFIALYPTPQHIQVGARGLSREEAGLGTVRSWGRLGQKQVLQGTGRTKEVRSSGLANLDSWNYIDLSAELISSILCSEANQYLLNAYCVPGLFTFMMSAKLCIIL